MPGKDYRVITVSFDADGHPARSPARRRRIISRPIGNPFPEEAWRFLTGGAGDIHELTEAVGFRFRKEIHGFTHPVVLIFLAPDGKDLAVLSGDEVLRTAPTYPITFSSFDLNMALTEAAQGKAVTGLKKALLYCFSHEPPGQSKFFSFLAVVGLVTLAAMAAFFIYLQVTTRRYRRGKEYDA